MILALALFFLELERYSAYRAIADPLHKVGCVPRDSVLQPIRGYIGNLLDNPLVDIEIQIQSRVIFLDNRARCSLNRLGPNTALSKKDGGGISDALS